MSTAAGSHFPDFGLESVPGSSTINQIEKIVAGVPLPVGKEVQEISSDYAQSILDKAATTAKKPLKETLSEASPEAFTLVELLLKFNPSRRMTAHAGLRHPYVARFHNTAQVIIRDRYLPLK